MRVSFPNSTRPKRAAKVLSKILNSNLAQCQQALAKATGYRDWHELEGSYSTLDTNDYVHELTTKKIIEREVSVISSLARELNANDGDIQYAIAVSRLTGHKDYNPQLSIDIRRSLFEKHELPRAGRYQAGEIGRTKIAKGEELTFLDTDTVILRNFGPSTTVITHKSAYSLLAKFEYKSPNEPASLFIPMRLYIPYGMWIEPDGSKVLFSRDYLPLWRLRLNRAPERIPPWVRINFISETWFWKGIDAPWNNKIRLQTEMERLKDFGIRGTPMLVESLPMFIKQSDTKDFKNAGAMLEEFMLRRS